MAILIGNETWSNEKITSQVYQATHDGVGNSLPHMQKSFISFSFGEKLIEDFGLIVVNNDKLERNIYSTFADATTTYDTLDGQIYWGSHFEANQLNFTLATDGMTEKQLDDFKEWFSPGKERELILAEHPNRAILARVATAPSIKMLPFEGEDEIKINGLVYKTSTTIYKGEISLSFVMDEPYWYSKLTYMPTYINKFTLEELDINSEDVNKVTSLQNKDMIKIMLEDGIPHQNNVMSTMFLGNSTLALEARVNDAHVGTTYIGIKLNETAGLTLSANEPAYLFYSGTAKSYPTIQFSMLPILDSFGYISNPRNKMQYLANQNSNSQNSDFEYSYIKIDNKIFNFTAPSILIGYNQAIKIFSEAINKAPSTVLEEIRENINEKYSRAWAAVCLNNLSLATESINENDVNTLINNMKKFININKPIKFIINSKTGEAKGFFSIKVIMSVNDKIDDASFYDKEEKVGDMICSEYLTIEGRNYLNSNGEIDIENCKEITSNESLTDVLILFKNMYL